MIIQQFANAIHRGLTYFRNYVALSYPGAKLKNKYLKDASQRRQWSLIHTVHRLILFHLHVGFMFSCMFNKIVWTF